MDKTLQSGGERNLLIATVLASGMSFIAGSAVNVILPAMQTGLNLTGAEMLWTVNAFALLLSALILVGGSLGDRYGRKRVFALGVGLFTLASLGCALAVDGRTMILARAVQGLGGALMVPGSLAVLSAGFPPERRGRAIGLWSTFSTLTIALGPVLGGWLAGLGLWRGIFLLNLPLALIVFYCLRGVTESRNPAAHGSLDWTGAALATVGLAGLTYGFTEGPGRGWSDPLVLVALLGGAAALVAFVFVEARSPAPLVPLGLFRSRTFSGGNLLTFFLYAALGVTFFFLPLNLIQAQGYPEAVAGLTLLPFILLVTVLSPWSGALADRIGPRLPLIVGPTIAGFGMAALALPGLTGGPAQYWTHFLPGIVLVGVGMGVTVAPLTTSVMKSAPDASAGAASGVNNALSRVGGVLAVAILGALALVSFGRSLEARTETLPLSAEARAALQAEASRLGGAAVPPGVEGETANLVREVIRQAFVDAYRLAMIVSAALAWLSALAAALLIRPPATEAEERAAPAFVADVNCVQIGDC